MEVVKHARLGLSVQRSKRDATGKVVYREYTKISPTGDVMVSKLKMLEKLLSRTAKKAAI